MERYDLAIIGAGIVGLATARELLSRRPGLRVAVVDRAGEVGTGQTGNNSGVIHAGIYYKPGSLKAKLCVDGAARMYAFCEERGIAVERCGKVIVALHEGELARLDELERRGRANGVPGLRRVDGDGLRALEPAAAGIAALHSPHTGIVDFAAVARAYADDVRAAGGDREAARLAARAEHRVAGGDLPALEAHAAVVASDGAHRAAEHDLAAGLAHVVGQGARDRGEVDDAGVR